MTEIDYSLPKWQLALQALREPRPEFSCVPNVVRQSMADVIEALVREIETLEQRARDREWLQEAAFQLLIERDDMPSSGELIAAYERAKAGRCQKSDIGRF